MFEQLNFMFGLSFKIQRRIMNNLKFKDKTKFHIKLMDENNIYHLFIYFKLNQERKWSRTKVSIVLHVYMSLTPFPLFLFFFGI